VVPTTRPPSIAKAASQEVRRLSLPVIAIGAILAMLYFGRVFLITAMTAVTIAFILDPFVTVLMRLRLPRSVASFVVCTAALLFLYVIGMGAYSQLTGLYGDLPKYGQRIADIVDGVQQKIQGMESDTYRMLVPTCRCPPRRPLGRPFPTISRRT
jgi:predicted PurR-regulated permease PerM